MNNINYSMLLDFYELTMGNGYLQEKKGDTLIYFDVFFRSLPDKGGFAIMAGLDQFIRYAQNLKFTEHDIQYLRDQGIFDKAFLKYLENFKFECDVWSVPEGTPIFPQEPIITVRGPAIQAQLIETMLLLCVNHQSLIATKANRIVRAAKGKQIMEFGSRRAQGTSGSVYGARAAVIGGCTSTSCTLAGREFGIPVSGTMAHSWVQLFDTEEEAFRAYARQYPDQCILLVDTYDVLSSGIPNAIKIFNEELVPKGKRPVGIRIDSGDITYLSQKSRKMLDEAGFPDCKICVSNSLDEYIIQEMLLQGAPIDSFGVGERLITSSSAPVFGGVYKLCAVEENSNIIPRIKLSENTAKINTPGVKKIWRFSDNATGKYIADVVSLVDEAIPDGSYEIFDPEHVWKKKELTNYTVKDLRVKVFDHGKLCYKTPTVQEIQKYCQNEVSRLWDEVKRFENPHTYYVDLSEKLWKLKSNLILNNSR